MFHAYICEKANTTLVTDNISHCLCVEWKENNSSTSINTFVKMQFEISRLGLYFSKVLIINDKRRMIYLRHSLFIWIRMDYPLYGLIPPKKQQQKSTKPFILGNAKVGQS